MSGRSSIESLRRLSAASDAEAAAIFDVAGCEALLDSVTRLPHGRPRRAPRTTSRRRLVLAVAAVALVAIATAATWVALRGAPARDTTSVECVIQGVDTVIPASSGDPVHDCTVEWKRELGNAAPPLVAYDNTIGGVTVLPRGQKAPANWRTLESQNVALIELQNALDDYIAGLNSGCFDAKAATSLADTDLARFGFRRWTINIRSGAGACVGSGFVDPASRTVTLTPMSDPTLPHWKPGELAARLRPLAKECESLPAAVASARAVARDLGLSESARGYDLNAVKDNSLRCATIYETVGGTIFLTVRGPSG